MSGHAAKPFYQKRERAKALLALKSAALELHVHSCISANGRITVTFCLLDFPSASEGGDEMGVAVIAKLHVNEDEYGVGYTASIVVELQRDG